MRIVYLEEEEAYIRVDPNGFYVGRDGELAKVMAFTWTYTDVDKMGPHREASVEEYVAYLESAARELRKDYILLRGQKNDL